MATLPDRYWTDDRTIADLLTVIGAAAATGVTIQIPHIGSTGGPRVMEMLEIIAAAGGRGVRVTAEDYPYAAALGSLGPGEGDELTYEELDDVQPLDFGQRLTDETHAQFGDRLRKSSLTPGDRLQDRIPAMARKGRLQERYAG